MSLALVALKQRIAEVLDPPRVGTSGLATGVSGLDAILSDGGVPRGRLTEILGAHGSGRTTLVRRLIARTLEARLSVAYVDATRSLAPTDWAGLAAGEALWMVRPREASRGMWAADVLLRSGAFALVVLDGAPPLTRQVAVRLTRLAQESEAALVVMGEETHGTYGGIVGGAVRLRVRRRGDGNGRWRAGTRQHLVGGAAPLPVSPLPHATARRLALLLTIEKGGIHHTLEVGCAIGVARRLCADPAIPDRRGVAPAGRGGISRDRGPAAPLGAPGSPAAGAADRGHVLGRKPRCAEPTVARDTFVAATG